MVRIERALLVGVLTLSTAATAPIAAQEAGFPSDTDGTLERAGPQSTFDLVGFVGWVAPLNDITDDPASFATSVKPSVSFGGEGTLWFGSGFGLGFHGFWAPSELDVTQRDITAEVPEDLGDADYFSGVANLLYRLSVKGPAATVQPYFLLGAGIRHLAVSDEAAPTVEDTTDPQLTVGFGAFVQLASGVAVRFGLRDFVSIFEAEGSDSLLQNDILTSFGIGFRF